MRQLMILSAVFFIQVFSYAQVRIPFGKNNRIIYDLQKGTYTVILNGQIAFENVFATGTDIDSRTPVKRGYAIKKSGTSMVYTINSGPLQQLFYTYPGKDYCVIAIKVAGRACNYLSPVNTGYIATGARVLNVPFDNDMWFRYDAPLFDKADFTGSEVTAIYNEKSGIVIGSLEQDVWKTGIRVQENTLKVICGYTDSLRTHDVKVHGMVQAVDGYCHSAPIFIGYDADWRKGMETYAKTNMSFHPPQVAKWRGATPVCWNSWGVIQTKIDFAKAKGVVDFFHDTCKAYRTADHTLYIDLDSYWDNMSPSQLKEFAAYCREKGFKPGIYWAPFVDWGKYDRAVEGSAYRYKDTWTTQDGKYADTDGGRAMDPTHPATRQRIIHFMQLFKDWGYEMVKIDFLSHGAIEGDHFYDPAVTTGMQAFRKGMELIDSVAGNKMLLYAAISPNLATSRYVHMRRIACDAFNSIENTEYTLNSTAYGWWQSLMYNYMDADHVVFKDASLNANRARFASALVTGSLVTGDDYAADGPWKEVALQLLQDKELLAITKRGKSFRPVDENKVFIRDEYIAIFNYDNKTREYRVPLLKGGTARELFSKQTIPVTDTIHVKVEAGTAVIYRVK
ncbi:alpha-amylase family protein [Chitinophaga silvisoli]|uniref:Alpha-galactosidase n=1 Tax=Chitinophaga silvisoli TaxID=2291814 RepID=A0A3E1NN92_9BACT|nr:alpha-galactosidase [Chitinophaga silvisoli]RFM29390.1 alpha-galactosidase [Chitinophaga silvisoli]